MVKIRQHAALVLMLATAALVSSYDVQESVRDGRYTRSRINQLIIHNLLCRGVDADLRSDLPKICTNSQSDNYIAPTRILLSNYNDDTEISKDDKYNGEGFRKEQWHNYPRRLDRLQKESLRRAAVALSDEARGEPERAAGAPHDRVPRTNLWEPSLATSNLNTIGYDTNWNSAGSERRGSDDDIYADDRRYDNDDDSRRIQKRIFSLWSRLHGLAPAGPGLQHRRHFFALHAGPADGGLSAEPRGGLARPAGSPLRWG